MCAAVRSSVPFPRSRHANQNAVAKNHVVKNATTVVPRNGEIKSTSLNATGTSNAAAKPAEASRSIRVPRSLRSTPVSRPRIASLSDILRSLSPHSSRGNEGSGGTVTRSLVLAANPLLTKEGWRDRASPIGRSLKTRSASPIGRSLKTRSASPIGRSLKTRSASPIGRSLKRRRAGVVAHTERVVVSDHPSCAFSAASPPL